MAGSQFSSPPPRTREQMELKQVERIRLRLEEDLGQATKREKEIRDRSVKLEGREADKAALEELDDSALSNNEKILKASILSMHAYMDSKLDTIQDTLDQILNAMHKPGIRPAVLPSLPLSTTTGPYAAQSGPQPSGDKKDEALDTWLRTVLVWVRAKRTLVEEEVITAASYLEGSTTRWLNGLVASKGFGRNMGDWAQTHTLENFMDLVEASWHNPQQAQIATDGVLKLDARKYKSVRELPTTVERLIVVPGVEYNPEVLLTTFLRCLPTDIKNLLASEARGEYHTFETFSKKALDLEATLGSAQTPSTDGRKKKTPQEWKKKGSRLMMVDSDGNQTEIDDVSELVEGTELDGEESAEGSNLAAVVKTKAGGRGKGGQQRGQGQAANPNKIVAWVRAGLDQEVWRDRWSRGACINCGEYGHTQFKYKNPKVSQKIPPKGAEHDDGVCVDKVVCGLGRELTDGDKTRGGRSGEDRGGRVVGRWVTDGGKTRGNKSGEDGGDEVRGGEVAEAEIGGAVVGETRRGDSAGGNAGMATDAMEERTETKGDTTDAVVTDAMEEHTETKGDTTAAVATDAMEEHTETKGDTTAAVATDAMAEHTETKGDTAAAGRVAPAESIVEATKADEEETANRKGAARVTNGMEGVTKTDEDAGAANTGNEEEAVIGVTGADNEEGAVTGVVRGQCVDTRESG
ncbi:hypothetical protein CBR_g54410 [Chara braunii]|uniref:Uncharacterized protein n=1 Tax=Chara braunii TaxID=69332 RepID=A0A388MC18_CHABU|nr:hypothetical protein CBR_g54410 [Chara braunii]|eukprot:GBG92110.1 hypothetical protein CBR_g54410 [Chara braunii]